MRQDAEAADSARTRYPAEVWPIDSQDSRMRLLAQIERDLRLGVLGTRDAYSERLHYAYRCMAAGV